LGISEVLVVERSETTKPPSNKGRLEEMTLEMEPTEEEMVRLRGSTEVVEDPFLASGVIVSCNTDVRIERDLEELLLVDLASAVTPTDSTDVFTC
jgi:hypothetical protein